MNIRPIQIGISTFYSSKSVIIDRLFHTHLVQPGRVLRGDSVPLQSEKNVFFSYCLNTFDNVSLKCELQYIRPFTFINRPIPLPIARERTFAVSGSDWSRNFETVNQIRWPLSANLSGSTTPLCPGSLHSPLDHSTSDPGESGVFWGRVEWFRGEWSDPGEREVVDLERLAERGHRNQIVSCFQSDASRRRVCLYTDIRPAGGDGNTQEQRRV